MNQFLKLLFELGPLLVFFLVNGKYGIFPGTAAFMAAAAIAIPAMWIMGREIPIMPIVSGVFLLVFGGLTLYFDNKVFFYMKPTIINLLFAAVLFFGRYFTLEKRLNSQLFICAFHFFDIELSQDKNNVLY